MQFCYRVGMDYVSCSPFRVPIARLAAAQAAISGDNGMTVRIEDFLNRLQQQRIVINEQNSQASGGMSGRSRLIAEFVIAAIAAAWISSVTTPALADKLAIPFFKEMLINFGIFYIPFAALVRKEARQLFRDRSSMIWSPFAWPIRRADVPI